MRGKPLVIGASAVVFLVVAASLYYTVTVEKVAKSVSAVVSPDGRYKAVRVSLSRGGSDPFCFDSIAIFLSVYPDSFAESEKTYEVYRAACASPAERAGLPKLEWQSNHALRITYPPTVAVDRDKPLMKNIDASKYVHVTYVAGK